MGHHCCTKQKVKRGLWSPEEDEKLVKFITIHGHGCWSSVPKLAGLQRCGKSCRLRWINYLRPDLKRGSFSEEEERIIIDVHRILGNRWAQIAKHLPGRTDNEVKNFWNSCIKKKLVAQGLDPKTHNLMPTSRSNSYNNNLTNNFSPQFPSSTIPFTISSPSKSNFDPSNSNQVLDIDPALLSLHPQNHLTTDPNTPIANYPYQGNGVLMSFTEQNPNPAFDFTNATSCSSSSLEYATIPSSSSFNQPNRFIDESAMWAPNCIDAMEMSDLPNEVVEPTIYAMGQEQPTHEPPSYANGRVVDTQPPNYVNGRVVDITQPSSYEHGRVLDFNDATNEKGMEIDTNYAGNAFDIDLMDSGFMPCGAVLYGGGNSMEQVQWDC